MGMGTVTPQDMSPEFTLKKKAEKKRWEGERPDRDRAVVTFHMRITSEPTHNCQRGARMFAGC